MEQTQSFIPRLLVSHARHQEVTHNGLTWLCLRNLLAEQIAYLHEQFQLHPLHLDALTARSQRPTIDDNTAPPYILLVLHIPVFNELARLPIVSEVALFAGPDYVIMAHDGHLRPLVYLFEDAVLKEAVRDEVMGRGSGYLLFRIIELLFGTCKPLLVKLDTQLDQIDYHMFRDNTLELVRDLSYARRDIISMRRIIRPNLPLIESLAAKPRPFLHLHDEQYFDDLLEMIRRIWEILEDQKEIVEGLDATLASMTSHRINREIKNFTLISLLFLPMTLIASILGMNVVIPFAEHQFALAAVLMVMLLVAGGMILFLRWRNWM
jgi:magnesium transporter